MNRVILVFGGGGVKGLAHLGAWKAVEELGLPVREIVGTSIGALVGACIAGGASWAELAPRALNLKKREIAALNRWAVLINGIRQPSVFLAEPLREFIRSVLPVERFADMMIPFGLNAVDLETGRTEWFGAGGRTDVPLAEAVYASCALPMFFPPARIGDRHFVDGGVGDTLAIGRAAARGADLIVAVDVAAGEEKDALDTVSKGMIAIQHRVYDILSHARRRAQLASWSGPPLVHVRPRLDGYSTFDFGRTRYFLEEGYRAARQALDAWSRPSIPAV